MQPHQSGRRIFQLVFYPLFTNISLLFNNFIHDLRQLPQIRLVLVCLVAYLTVLSHILQRIIVKNQAFRKYEHNVALFE